MKMQLKPIFYYSIVGGIVLSQTLATLFHSAVGLTYHARYNSQEKEKQLLTQEIDRLQTEAASKASIASVTQSPLKTQFTPISEVVSLKVSDTLAAIQ